MRISARNNRLKIVGDKEAVEQAHRFFLERLKESRGGKPVPKPTAARPASGAEAAVDEGRGEITYHHSSKVVRARTKNQHRYLEAIRDHDIVFSIGPAGTGKTYLAMATALDYLKKKRVVRIILTRPVVEAGESLGYLPGDLYAKVNPYLRPLYDALHDMMSYEEANRCLDRGTIEVAPLAYMRGRTLSDAFVILDEAQNTTHPQMKMFLTRLGESSRAVVTGDITQIDLQANKKSGLLEARRILANIKGIKFIYLDETDVVRHPLVQEILKAYEKLEHKD